MICYDPQNMYTDVQGLLPKTNGDEGEGAQEEERVEMLDPVQ